MPLAKLAPITPAVGDRLMSVPEVMARVGIKSRSTVYVYIETGVLPRPVKIGPRRVAWLSSTIDSWMHSKKLAA